VLVYRCILVPLDGTHFGEHALPHAVAIARRCGAVLHLAHVHLPPIIPSGAETAALPPVWIEMSWDEKRRYLDLLAQRLVERWGVRVETQVMEGGVATALERHAVRCAAGLIVMSTHGHVGLSRLWHHGIADQLARDLPLPILLVRAGDAATAAVEPQGEAAFTNILIPLDGSAESELVIEHAVTLGRSFGAKYTLVRVVAPEGAGDSGAQATPLQQGHTVARQYLNALAERLRSRGLEVATEVLDGEEAAAPILARARAHPDAPRSGVDLVAVESPERGAVTRLFFRSTADQLIGESPVPVLLFRAPRATAVGMVAEAGLVGSG
jgi:nucleotide-binding universal stress UspA family protein